MRKVKRDLKLAVLAHHMEHQRRAGDTSLHLLLHGIMCTASRQGYKNRERQSNTDNSQSSASWEGCHHSSFCSAPSDGQSSRQQGASTSAPSDWLSLLAKAHGIGWARGASSKGWLMAEAAELPFSCWVATSGVEPASSEGFGGLLAGGEDDIWWRTGKDLTDKEGGHEKEKRNVTDK